MLFFAPLSLVVAGGRLPLVVVCQLVAAVSSLVEHRLEAHGLE